MIAPRSGRPRELDKSRTLRTGSRDAELAMKVSPSEQARSLEDNESAKKTNSGCRSGHKGRRNPAGDVRIRQLRYRASPSSHTQRYYQKKHPWAERSTASLVLAWRHGSLADCIGSLLSKQMLCWTLIPCLGRLELAPLDPNTV